MTPMAEAWLDNEGLRAWAFGQTNAALRDAAASRTAADFLAQAGLPAHPDQPKNWDSCLAVFHAARLAAADQPILDAGAERYSSFLPALSWLGYQDLTGVNLTLGAPETVNGAVLRHGDITATGFADRSFSFIACLSVIEHGVDVAAFLREAGRLLRPGGALFMSFDYWSDPVDTGGQIAYGVPIRIFGRSDITEMIAWAADMGMRIIGPADFTCADRVVCWQRFGLRYTFANLLLRKD